MKYDETHFYRKHFQHCAASKCVDLVAFNTDTNEPLWLIEIKDYRAQRRTKTQDLCDELAQKVRDTLANLFLVQRKEGKSVLCYISNSRTSLPGFTLWWLNERSFISSYARSYAPLMRTRFFTKSQACLLTGTGESSVSESLAQFQFNQKRTS